MDVTSWLLALPELEFFILAIVRSGFEGLSTFESPNLGMIVNRLEPHFTREQLIKTLSAMFRCGDLVCRRAYRTRAFVPTIAEIDAALCGALDLTYWLTPQGGARWERMARFDWNCHISGCEFEHEALRREAIEVYLHSFANSKGKPVPEPRYRTIRPWKATYWKILPQGVRAIQPVPETENESSFGHSRVDTLWAREWSDQRQGKLREYIPMRTERVDPAPSTGWRTRFLAVQSQRPAALLRLLRNRDRALQYAAGLRLAELGGHQERLIEWFLDRKTRATLRVLARLDHPTVQQTLLDAFEAESWEYKPFRRSAYLRDLCEAVARRCGEEGLRVLSTLGRPCSEERLWALTAMGKAGASLEGVQFGSNYEASELFDALRGTAAGEKMRLAFAQLVYAKDADIHDRRTAASKLAETDPAYRDEHERLTKEAIRERRRWEINQLTRQRSRLGGRCGFRLFAASDPERGRCLSKVRRADAALPT